MAEAGFAFAEGGFGFLAFGDVAGVEEDGGLAGVEDAVAGEFDWHGAAIGVEADAFEFGDLAGDKAREIEAGLVAGGGGDEVPDELADDFFAGQAVQPAGGGVHVEHAAGNVLDEDGVG